MKIGMQVNSKLNKEKQSKDNMLQKYIYMNLQKYN